MLLGAGVLTILALIAVAAGLVYTVWKINSIDRVDVDLAAAAASGPQNFLLVGSDTREIAKDTPDAGGIFGKGDSTENSGQRADTIVIARVDPTRTSVELLSIPRDLWVDVPDSKDHQRINATYNQGPQSLINTLQENLGVEINHYVEVNFESFKGLVDAIGGVPMYFDRPMYDQNTGLAIRKKGCYNLDAVQALAFARSRHLVYSNGVKWVTDGTADMGRITRQQIFLRRAMAKIATLGIADVNTMRKLIDVGVDNVTVDSELGTSEMLALGKKFSKFKADTMVTHRLPTEATRTDGGASVLVLDDAAATGVLDIFRGVAEPAEPAQEESTSGSGVTTTTIANASVTVSVLNGTGTSGLARKAGDQLAAMSFNLGEVANAEPAVSSVVSYGKGGKPAAQAVANHISPTPSIAEDPALPAGAVRLVLGSEHEEVVTNESTTSTTPTTVADGSAAEKPVGYVTGDPPAGVECGPG
ncbi:MAG TPA: LCP family protein [Microthrixaceae bacterium]|nr:LCP family protein [Microthrixaceae bacterium]